MTMSEKWTNVKRSAIDVLVMFIVSCFSLSTLVYVAEGDASRIYYELYHGTVYSQGQLVQTEVELFLHKDLPLRQFAGFKAVTDPLLAETSVIGNVRLLNDLGETLFASSTATGTSRASSSEQSVPEDADNESDATQSEEITLPLRNKFETVGKVVMELRLDKIKAHIAAEFQPLWILVLICSIVFAVLTFLTRTIVWERKRVWTAIAFTATFVLVACVTTFTLVNLYTDGASAKGKALLTSLSGRLDDVTNYKIDFDQFVGIDRLFGDYRRLTPDISAIALIVDGTAKFHSDNRQVGLPWTAPQRSFEYSVDISEAKGFRSTLITIALQKDVVYRQITDCIRNILALFVASALFAYFSMSVACCMQEAREGKIRGQAMVLEFGIGLIKPLFFLATFIENLNYAFLPQYVQDAVKTEHLSLGLTSLPFIAFYLCFALSILPAERTARSFGPHKLILGGLLLVAMGLIVLAGQFGFVSIVLARALSGIGQGLVFIGVQFYVLDATSTESRTRGASVIVIGFQAGMMSGMAIGSLLVSQLGPQGVFGLGTMIALVTAIYTLLVVPKLAAKNTNASGSQPQVLRNIVLTLRDPQFLKTIWLIGLPAKAVLTGVILFALPLLLIKQGFRQEDVGQITMTYGAAVIAASAWVSARATWRRVSTGNILVMGALLSGAGLLLISTVGWKPNGFDVSVVLPSVIVVVIGVIIIGIGYGFINAPVITQVTESRISGRLGAGPVAATYRLLERAGHTTGPMIVGQVAVLTGSGTLGLGWIGGALIAFGTVFAVSLQIDKTSRAELRVGMMERNAMNSAKWFAKLTLLVLAVASASSGHATAAPLGQWPTWFKLDTNLAKNWEAVEVPGDNGSVLLRLAMNRKARPRGMCCRCSPAHHRPMMLP